MQSSFSFLPPQALAAANRIAELMSKLRSLIPKDTTDFSKLKLTNRHPEAWNSFAEQYNLLCMYIMGPLQPTLSAYVRLVSEGAVLSFLLSQFPFLSSVPSRTASQELEAAAQRCSTLPFNTSITGNISPTLSELLQGTKTTLNAFYWDKLAVYVQSFDFAGLVPTLNKILSTVECSLDFVLKSAQQPILSTPPKVDLPEPEPKKPETKTTSSITTPVAVRGKRGPKRVRQRRVEFTEEETRQLIDLVHKFGVGKWVSILREGKFNSCRTPVSLKDRWRNILKRHKRLQSLGVPDDLLHLDDDFPFSAPSPEF